MAEDIVPEPLHDTALIAAADRCHPDKWDMDETEFRPAAVRDSGGQAKSVASSWRIASLRIAIWP